MKKTLCLVFTAVILLSVLFTVPANGALYNDYLENDFFSDCVILICTDNDEVIFSKNPNKQTMPASLTKVMTATIVLNECQNLDLPVTVPESCIEELTGTGSSLGGLKAGETLSIYNLLCCLLLQSANEAATTLAEHICPGDRDAFVEKMNTLATELGCTNTNFVNVHGLDDEYQYTTVTDMALIFRNATRFSTFNDIIAMGSYVLPETNMHSERTINTTNFTILPGYREYYCEHAKGGKTGSTSGAGHCLVTRASNNGYNYIAVAMNAPKEDFDKDGVDENGAFIDCKTMFDWAFDNLRLVSIANSAKVVGEVPVRFGKGSDYITLSPSDTAYGLMPKAIEPSSLLIKIDPSTIPNQLSAPVHKGQVVCQGDVLYADKVVARIDLVSSLEVKRSFISSLGTLIKKIISSSLFRLISVAVVAALIILVFMGKKAKAKNDRKSYSVVGYKDFQKKNNSGKKR